MEESTPVGRGSTGLDVKHLDPIRCDLGQTSLDDIFEDDDFEWLTTTNTSNKTTPLAEEEDDELQQVYACHCQACPTNVPRCFTPCCLSPGVVLASREIQMKEDFRANLLGTDGAPPKTQTMRKWCPERKTEHRDSFLGGKWVRVWRGQGHKSTIGWLLIVSWDKLWILITLDCATLL